VIISNSAAKRVDPE